MLIEILTNTPLWVFGLFVGLVILGWQQSRDRVVKHYVMFIQPVAMVILSFLGVLGSFGFKLLPMLLWSSGLGLTAFIGATFFAVKGVEYRCKKAVYSVKGSWIPFALMMAIFFTKYSIGVVSALNPALIKAPFVIIVCSILYGLFSGIFAGRALSIWRLSRNNQICE